LRERRERGLGLAPTIGAEVSAIFASAASDVVAGAKRALTSVRMRVVVVVVTVIVVTSCDGVKLVAIAVVVAVVVTAAA
jgi:hypothetical protein